MPAMKGQRHCFTHSPNAATARRSARQKGGRTRGIGYGVPADVSSIGALQRHLAQALGDSLIRPNSERRCVTIARLVEVARKLIEVGEVQQRLELVEARLAEMEGR
jgi:hypothetical protein